MKKLSLVLLTVLSLVFVGCGQDNTETIEVKDPLAVKAEDHVVGPIGAQVTLIEFADFQCPACAAYHPLVERLKLEYKDKVRFVYRSFPLRMHKNALVAATAAEAANKQGKFWEMGDKLFTKQTDWAESDKASEIFEGYAKDLGLDVEKFKQDMKDKAIEDSVKWQYASGLALGVNGTPSFFLNGKKIANPQTYEEFKKFIDAASLLSDVPADADEKIHVHADFKVALNSKFVDFSQDKYQSKEGKELHVYTLT